MGAYAPPVRRNWTFWVQGSAMVMFSFFAISVNGWFMWRMMQLASLGDMWPPVIVFGTLLGPLFILFSGILWTLFFKIAAVPRPENYVPERIEPSEMPVVAPMLQRPKALFYLIVTVLGGTAAFGLFAWIFQLYNGLQVTGMDRPVFWGFYIINFVFFIGISHAGTLISAILRIANAEWRRSITRSAEVITVLVLIFGGGNILLDLGRPDRLLNMFMNGRLQSPLLWDMCSITTYLMASTIYLYIPLIPDIAILRDNTKGWRRPFYELLSMNWSGTPAQKHVLEKCIAIMAIVVIPVAVSVHTVVSYVFAMTIQPMWHSAIFGPYFVVGAIFSGIAALIIAMAVLRRVYHLETFLKPIHFNYLGILLLVMSVLWLYFTFGEYLTTWYGGEPDHMVIFDSKLHGKYSIPFWTMVVTCFVIPFPVLVSRLRKTVYGCVIASIPVCVGMWLERYNIVIPTLVRPRLPYATASYTPSWVEVGLFVGCVGGFILLYALFTRLFPIVSLWEVREGQEHAPHEVAERVATYFPAKQQHARVSPNTLSS